MFLVALAVFIGASAACGQAQNLTQLVVFRIVQGAGGGLLTPVGTAMLYRAYPPRERARMTRILLVPVLLGPVLAQPLGGLLVTALSWRWAFYLNVPFGAAAFAVGMLFLVEHREPATRRIDVPGFVLSGVGLSALLYAVSQGSVQGWASTSVILTGAVGVVALTTFVAVERREPSPMLNLRLLGTDRLFRATNIVSFVNTAGFTGLLFLGPVFLQEAMGLSALDAGLTSFSVALGVLVASQTIGRLYPYVGPRRMAAAGSTALALVLCAFVLIGLGTNLWIVRIVMFLAGAANSANGLAIQTSMFATISSADTGHASAILNAGRQTSTAVGIAILTTVVSGVSGSVLTAFHYAFLAAAGFAFLAAIACWFIHDSDAAATMVRHRGGVPVPLTEPVLAIE